MRYALAPELAVKKQGALMELSKKGKFLVVFESAGAKLFFKTGKIQRLVLSMAKWVGSWRNIYFLPMVIGPISGLVVLIGVIVWVYSCSYLSLFLYCLDWDCLSMVFKPLMTAMKAMPNDSGFGNIFRPGAGLLEKEDFDHPFLQAYQKTGQKAMGFWLPKPLEQAGKPDLSDPKQDQFNVSDYSMFFSGTDFYVAIPS